MATLRADSQAAADKAAADAQAYADAQSSALTVTAPADFGVPKGTTITAPVYDPTFDVGTGDENFADVTPNDLTGLNGLSDRGSPAGDNSYTPGQDGSGYPVTTATTGATHLTADEAAAKAKADELAASRISIYELMAKQFEIWGVTKRDAQGNYTPESAAFLSQLKGLATTGVGQDMISLTLQGSDAYKSRFAGNAQRLKSGLAALSPADYIASETAHDQILRAAGIDTSVYLTKDMQTALIGGDVSPTELNARVALAAKSIANADPFYTQTLQNYYGLTSGQMIAHVLDPTAAMPLLEKQAISAGIGSAASKQGLGISATTAQNLYGQNITEAQAQQGFQNIALNIAPEQGIAARFGGDAGAQGQNLVASTFGLAGAAYAEQQMRALNTRETNEFSGSAGAAKGSLYSDSTGVL